MSFDTSKLPEGVGDNAFYLDVGGTTDGGEGGAKENGVVVDADSSGLEAKGGDGGENVNLGGGGIGLDFNEDGDDSNCCVAYCSKDIAMTGGVEGRGGTLDVQSQGVKRVWRITVTGRAAVDRGYGRLGSSTIRAER